MSFFRLKHPKPTPQGIRRGGASWHFKLHGLYDRTVEHGRWSCVRSARIYINEAAAEESAEASCKLGLRRIEDAVALCPELLRTNWFVVSGRSFFLSFAFLFMCSFKPLLYFVMLSVLAAGVIWALCRCGRTCTVTFLERLIK